jgi:hypothetical protein
MPTCTEGTVWATPTNPLARLWYENMDAAYFNAFGQAYNVKRAGNFIKPGLNVSAISSNFTVTKIVLKQMVSDTVGGVGGVGAVGAGTAAQAQPQAILLSLQISDHETHAERGAPATAEILYEISNTATGGLALNVTVQWFNKTMCHAPETIWLSNVPVVGSSKGWLMDKMGQPIDPLDADLRGTNKGAPECNSVGTTCGVHLHAVGDGGVSYTGSEGAISLRSLDSALVSIGSAIPVPTPLLVPDPKAGGVHFALVGNIWNTNYPFWYPFVKEDTGSKFRFNIHVD